MLNPNTVQLAQMIAEAFPDLLVEREGNVVTLEDAEGSRYLVTVESMYSGTNDATPLPDPDQIEFREPPPLRNEPLPDPGV